MKKTQIICFAAAIALLAGCTSYREQTGSAKQVSFNQLPPAVQATIHNEVGNRPIARIDQETKYGEPAYRVEVETPGPNSKLWVASDGSIIKESRRIVSQRPAGEAAGAQANPNY